VRKIQVKAIRGRAYVAAIAANKVHVSKERELSRFRHLQPSTISRRQSIHENRCPSSAPPRVSRRTLAAAKQKMDVVHILNSISVLNIFS
jgi:hypothetical protein